MPIALTVEPIGVELGRAQILRRGRLVVALELGPIDDRLDRLGLGGRVEKRGRVQARYVHRISILCVKIVRLDQQSL